jgi:hypothetical protein
MELWRESKLSLRFVLLQAGGGDGFQPFYPFNCSPINLSYPVAFKPVASLKSHAEMPRTENIFKHCVTSPGKTANNASGMNKNDNRTQTGFPTFSVPSDRAKIPLAILAWSFARWLRCPLLTDPLTGQSRNLESRKQKWLRCSLLADPLAGYARCSRLASGQNSRALIAELIFARTPNEKCKSTPASTI